MGTTYQPINYCFIILKFPFLVFFSIIFQLKSCVCLNTAAILHLFQSKKEKKRSWFSALAEQFTRLILMSHLHRCFSLLSCFQGDSGADNTQRGSRGQKGEIGPMVKLLCCLVLLFGFYNRMGQRKREKSMLPERCKFLKLVVPCQMEYFFH